MAITLQNARLCDNEMSRAKLVEVREVRLVVVVRAGRRQQGRQCLVNTRRLHTLPYQDLWHSAPPHLNLTR